MNDINYIGANELVFNTDSEEGVYSGGFSVNSIMMKAGMSPIMTLNGQKGGGDSNKVSDLFDSLVIPNWAVSYGNRMIGGEYKDNNGEDSDEDIDDELHDKLLGLVKEHENKLNQKKIRKTRKQKLDTKKDGTKNGGTKRRK
jgi:hypothetical protein